jgi:acyl-coenzyme A synthetase/AMP-(fatty) acid ligase
MSIAAPILHFGRTRRTAPALIDGARVITFGELAVLIRGIAGHLAATGVRRGERIGLCLKDTPEHLAALLGAALLGAVPVTLDWRAKPAENARFIEDLGLACVLAEPDTHPGGTCRVIALDAGWHAAVAAADPFGEPAGHWHDPFVISATSGSTGAPKFLAMTHAQFYFAISGMFELMALAGRHRYLSTMPLYYSGGRNSCLAHLLRGDCVVFYPSLFSAGEYAEVARRHAITIGGLVPSMVRTLLAGSAADKLLPGLHMLFCTGAPLHAEEKHQALAKLNPNFCERYGTTETLAISLLRPADFTTRGDSVGQPHSLAQIDIVDEADRVLRPGEVGRLRFRGPGLATPLPGSGANFRDGSYYPGEIAAIDMDGYIFLHGRSSDVIIRSGAKFYPAEIEATLAAHPCVAEAAVLGVAGAGGEDDVAAFVVVRAPVTVGVLLAHCRSSLTPHKVPRTIQIVDALPRTTAGKVDKRALGAGP